MRDLYQITKELQELLAALEIEDPEDLEEIAEDEKKVLLANYMEGADQVEECIQAYYNLLAEEKMLRAEAQRYTKRAQSAKKQSNRIRWALTNYLKTLEEIRFQCPTAKISLTDAVTFDEKKVDLECLPPRFVRVKREVAKKEVLAAQPELAGLVEFVTVKRLRIG